MLVLVCFSPVFAQTFLNSTSYLTPAYQSIGYSGSRILDTNYTVFDYSILNWTNQATLDSFGNQWIVDKVRHTLVMINGSDASLPFTAYGEIIAGTRGKAGHLDGDNSLALFNSPTGVAVWDRSVFVADTGNHCIRRIDLDLKRTYTVAGIPGNEGFLDGDGVAALFSNPSSLGIDASTGTLFVLDNDTRVRRLTIATEGWRIFTNVVTLVQGACRAQSVRKYNNIMMREVWCQNYWQASRIPAENINTWEWKPFCYGNVLTCQEN
jgi:hypothetical protein